MAIETCLVLHTRELKEDNWKIKAKPLSSRKYREDSLVEVQWAVQKERIYGGKDLWSLE